MKAKSTVPKKGKRLESLAVEPPKQPALPLIDLSKFSALSVVNDVLEKLYRNPEPSIVDCEDSGEWAYRQACALLIQADLADVGLHAQHSTLAEPITGLVVESIRLQVDIMRLASTRLFDLCNGRNQALAEGSEAA